MVTVRDQPIDELCADESCRTSDRYSQLAVPVEISLRMLLTLRVCSLIP